MGISEVDKEITYEYDVQNIVFRPVPRCVSVIKILRHKMKSLRLRPRPNEKNYQIVLHMVI